MNASQVPPRAVALAVLVSSFMLGTVAAQSDRQVDPALTKPAQDLSQMDEDRPATNAATPDANATVDTERTEVGSKASNVDEDSSSGSYYPYSAGTVGDDPAKPTSTSVSTDASDSGPGPTDQWGDAADSDGDGYLSRAEVNEAAPELSASFDAMDVDGDNKLTRGEFRSWHESRKTRVKTDEAKSKTDDSTSSKTTPPDDSVN